MPDVDPELWILVHGGLPTVEWTMMPIEPKWAAVLNAIQQVVDHLEEDNPGTPSVTSALEEMRKNAALLVDLVPATRSRSKARRKSVWAAADRLKTLFQGVGYSDRFGVRKDLRPVVDDVIAALGSVLAHQGVAQIRDPWRKALGPKPVVFTHSEVVKAIEDDFVKAVKAGVIGVRGFVSFDPRHGTPNPWVRPNERARLPVAVKGVAEDGIEDQSYRPVWEAVTAPGSRELGVPVGRQGHVTGRSYDVIYAAPSQVISALEKSGLDPGPVQEIVEDWIQTHIKTPHLA